MSQVNDWQSVYQWKADGRVEQRIMYVSHTYNPIASTHGETSKEQCINNVYYPQVDQYQ